MHGFVLVNARDISAYKCRASLYKHEKTGAELLSLESDDTNKVFGANFRTPPENSTGLAHILEHSVLCGSRKYPVKEPFVELLKGSLQTFLNAFTYPDKTCYPVASENLQDFYNLVDVYLDAVFHPLITREIFEQEGWHYHMESLQDPLSYQGVVYNEMKGAYSSPDSLLVECVRRHLLSDSVYRFDYGGHPESVPELSYEEFLGFHKSCYHPSNVRFFFSGDDPVAKRLEIIDACVSAFDAGPVSPSISSQPRWDKPRCAVEKYASSEKSAYYTMSWLLPEVADVKSNFSFAVLNYILLGMSGSPLRKALIDSGLGSDLAGAGLENELKQMYFSAGLKGVKVSDGDKVRELIMSALTDLSSAPPDAGLVEAAFNTVEFQLRENNTGAYPRGLLLMLRALSSWLYDSNPIEMLDFEAPLEMTRKAHADDPMFFPDLIRRHLIDNLHRSEVLLVPDPGYGEELESAERARLDSARKAMSEDGLMRVVEHTAELRRMQEKEDEPSALASIPGLRVSDMNRSIRITPQERREVGGSSFCLHPLVSNGIVYVDLAFSLKGVEFDQLPMARLLGVLLLEMGTSKEDFASLSMRISRETGGVTSLASAFSSKDHDSVAFLVFRAKATFANTGRLCALLNEILAMPDFSSQKRFKQIAAKARASVEAMLVPNGHLYVSNRLFASLHPAGAAEDVMNGVGYLLYLKELTARVDSDWDGISSELSDLHKTIVNKRRLSVSITADPDALERVSGYVASVVESLPDRSVQLDQVQITKTPRREILTVPSRINYIGEAIALFDSGYSYHGSINVIRRYLSASFLWDQIRVQGGAYGAFCRFDPYSGVLILCSYRDPHVKRTLDVYASLADHLEKLKLSQDELEKTIVGCIGEQDPCELPDARGYSAFIRSLRGLDDQERRHRRDEIFNTSPCQFNELGALIRRSREERSSVVLVDSGKIEELKTLLANPSVMSLL